MSNEMFGQYRTNIKAIVHAISQKKWDENSLNLSIQHFSIKQLTKLDPYGKILNTAYYGRRFRAAQVIYSALCSESIIKEG